MKLKRKNTRRNSPNAGKGKLYVFDTNKTVCG